ncbi:MAG TPA: o-succinylbenzoate synthase [Bacteroidales bacterium]|nr:o-succinylbenzoate synthase [Bacteroidales bacterium]
MKAFYTSITLQFKFPAGTSRGVLNEKPTYFLMLERDGITGIGECSTIPGLSIDDPDTYESKLAEVCQKISAGVSSQLLDLSGFPSIQFGLETALLDLNAGGKRLLFPGPFTEGTRGIDINGLVWMGSREFMTFQIDQKIKAGFRCIKLKVGSLNFQTELEILAEIRKKYSASDLEIRLDANGAFHPAQAMEKLELLAAYGIHSIEQPIRPQHHESMAALCADSPIPIALDEELIGVTDNAQREYIVKTLKPKYLIIKPSLIGGFSQAEKWIALASGTSTGWWLTSALESNIGLNALAQWVTSLSPTMPQGLGTGQLYTNNIPSPLCIEGDKLFYKPSNSWDLTALVK